MRLTLEGLRSFRSPVEIDFTGREHVAIIGDTGAGKSSMLEAMTWALYGQTSWSGQPNQELMNDTSTTLRVVLWFAVRGEEWEVSRTLRRAGDGHVGPAKVQLVHRGPKGQELEKLEAVRPVEARVQELLGLDHAAFTRTVVLPQGQFAQLLVSDRNTDRARILRQVWRLEELTNARAAVEGALQHVLIPQVRAHEALRDQPDDPEAHLASLRAAAAELADAATQTAAWHRAGTDAEREAAAAEELSATCTAVQAQLRFDHVDARALAEGIAGADGNIASRREALIAEREHVASLLDAIPADSDGLKAGEVATVRAALLHLPSLIDELRRAREAVQVAQTKASADAARSDAAKLEADAAQQAVTTHESARPLLAGRVTQVAERRSGIAAALSEARTARQDALDLDVKVAQQQSAQDEQADQLAKAREAAADTAQTLRTARARRTQADREHAAVAAARGIQPGDACPVCDRGLPPTWTAPMSDTHDEAVTALTRAEEQAAEAASLVTRLESAVEHTAQRLEELQQRAGDANRRAASSLVQVAERFGVTGVDLDQPDHVLFADLERAAAAAVEALAEHDRIAAELAKQAQERHGLAAAAAATACSALERVTAEQQGAERADTALRNSAAALATSAEVTLLDGPDGTIARGVDAALARLDDREQQLDARVAQRTQRQRELDHLGEALSALDVEWHDRVMRPLTALARTLDAHREVLRTAADRLGADEIQLPSVAGIAPEALPELVAALVTRTTVLEKLAERRSADADTSTAAARAQLAHIGLALDVAPDAPPSDVLAVAAERDEHAKFEARTAANAATAFAAQVVPLQQLQQASASLDDKRLVLEDLSAALKDGAFPKWVTLRRSRALLVHASRLLGDMTGDRYAFADLGAEDDDWKVIDNDSGLPRSPASLSGGEKFVASLALALGMVEMMARSGGRLESLWLDEGFGALDRSNLDAAVEALATVASGGRMVAVISHVRAVAERVDHVLAVTASSTGSKARWLSALERAHVEGYDLEASGQSTEALAGLLE